MKNKVLFLSLAAVSVVLMIFIAITGGIETRKMNAYNAEKDKIVNAPPKSVDGLIYFNSLTSAEQYVYENLKQSISEFKEYTPKLAFVPTEEELGNAVNALLADDPAIFFIDPEGFSYDTLEFWMTKAETTAEPETESPVQTEPPVTERLDEDETEDDGPPDIPVMTDPPATETEPETEEETEPETAKIVDQVIDGLYAKFKIPYLYSIEDVQIMSKRLTASLIKSDIAVENCNSDFEKALALSDYLTEVCKNKYDTELCDTAYGALVKSGANGEGYARAYKLLLARNGLISHIAYGKYKGTESAWNVVLLEGKYYNVDTFASDPDMIVDGQPAEGMFTHVYFCANDEFLKTTHVLNEGQSIPKCTDSRNYYDIFSLKAENEQMLKNISKKLISECVRTGENTFEICVTYTTDTGKILDVVTDVAKEMLEGEVDVSLYIPIAGAQSYVFKLKHIPPQDIIIPPETDVSTDTAKVTE